MHPTHRMRSRNYVTVALALALLALSAPAVAAAKPGPSYRQDLQKLDTKLRLALESLPESLKGDLAAAKTTCQDAKNETDPQSAQVAWKTLSNIVNKVSSPLAVVIVRALGDDRADLDDLEATYSRAWRGQHKRVNTLKLGVAKTDHGVRLYLTALRPLGDAFDSWNNHNCAGALKAIQRTNERIPPAVKAINGGMRMLKSLR